MNNTRFNPTVNNYLHVGHVCMALVNEAEAIKAGGKLIIRMDDTQQYWNDKLGSEKVTELIKSAKYLFDKIMKPGFQFTRQSEYRTKQNDLLQLAKNEPVMYFHDRVPSHKRNFTYYPYTAKYTAEKVIMDMLDEVSFLVRGEDLITEYALYEYYVEKFGFPKVVHWYLPRLMILDGENVVEMSKTKENGDVARYLAFCEGSYEDLVKLLKRSYLKNPAGTWEIQNVKENPVLSKVKIK